MPRLTVLAIAASLVLAAALSEPPGAPPAGGTVLHAVDGDTLDVQTDAGAVVRVRLLGVDCPELHHPTRGREWWGEEAAQHTRTACEGRKVRLTYDPHQTTDRYGRSVAYVWVDGRLLNLELLREGHGFAWEYEQHARARSFNLAENAARQAYRGLWQRMTIKRTTP